MAAERRADRPAPFEHVWELRCRDVCELGLGCLLLLPLLRVVVSLLCAALGALWCSAVALAFWCLDGPNP